MYLGLYNVHVLVHLVHYVLIVLVHLAESMHAGTAGLPFNTALQSTTVIYIIQSEVAAVQWGGNQLTVSSVSRPLNKQQPPTLHWPDIKQILSTTKSKPGNIQEPDTSII